MLGSQYLLINIGLLTMNVVKSIVRILIQSSTTNIIERSAARFSGADDKILYNFLRNKIALYPQIEIM